MNQNKVDIVDELVDIIMVRKLKEDMKNDDLMTEVIKLRGEVRMWSKVSRTLTFENIAKGKKLDTLGKYLTFMSGFAILMMITNVSMWR